MPRKSSLILTPADHLHALVTLTHRRDTSRAQHMSLLWAVEKVSAPVEYEYNVEETDIKNGRTRVYVLGWGTLAKAQQSMARLRASQQIYTDYGGHAWYTYVLIRRPVPEAYVVLTDEGEADV